MARLVASGAWKGTGSIELVAKTAFTIGRNSPAWVTDKRISRKQVEVLFDGKDTVTVKRLGQNVPELTTAAGADVPLEMDKTVPVRHGDTLWLVAKEYPLTLELKAPMAVPAAAADDDKTDTEDNDDDGAPAWSATVAPKKAGGAAAAKRKRTAGSDDGSGVSGDEDEYKAPSKKKASSASSATTAPSQAPSQAQTASYGGGGSRSQAANANGIPDLGDFDDTHLAACNYGLKCYRKNPGHYKEYSHPVEHQAHANNKLLKQKMAKLAPAAAPARSVKASLSDDDDKMDVNPARKPAPKTAPKAAAPSTAASARPTQSNMVTLSVSGAAPTGFVDEDDEDRRPVKSSAAPSVVATPPKVALRTTTSFLSRLDDDDVPAAAAAAPSSKSSSSTASSSTASSSSSAAAPKPSSSGSSSSSSSSAAPKPATTVGAPAAKAVAAPAPAPTAAAVVPKLSSGSVPYIVLPLLGTSNGIPAETAATIAANALSKLGKSLPTGHKVVFHFIVDYAERTALNHALRAHPDLASWVNVDDGTMARLPAEANFVVVEVTWRFKPVVHSTIEWAGDRLVDELKSLHNTAKYGSLYNISSLDGSPWKKQGAKEILAVLVPNYNNPKKPDMLSDLDAAKTDLVRSFEALTETVQSWSSIVTLGGNPGGKGKERAYFNEDGSEAAPAPTGGGSSSSSSSSSSSRGGKGGAWSRILLEYVDHPDQNHQHIYATDDQTVTIFDKYPKARNHLLVLPKKHIAWLKDLTSADLPLIKHMFAVAQKHVKKMQGTTPGRQFHVGFHAVPSMQQVHLHVISRDLDSPALTNKKHWNSFASKFFLPAEDVIKLLERDGSIKIDKIAYEAMLDEPLRCPECQAQLQNIPKAKEHMLTHNFK